MKPLRIDVYLKNRMAAPGTPIHLDALLAYVTVKMNFDPEKATGPKYFRSLGEQLPIEKYEDQDDWFFKASMFMPTGIQLHSSEYYTQRIDQECLASNVSAGKVSFGRKKVGDLNPHEGKIDIVRGVHRNILGFYGVTYTDQLSAYCIGDPEEIACLLGAGYITHFGGRRRTGYGAILRFDINEDDNAKVKSFDRNRHVKLQDTDVPVVRPIRAPYWDQQYRRSAFIPADVA